MTYGLYKTPALHDKDCLVIGLLATEPLPDALIELDQHLNGLITRLATTLKEQGDYAWQSDVNNSSVLLVHCGERAQYTLDNLSKRMTDITSLLFKQRSPSATLFLPQLSTHTPDEQVQHMVIHLESNRYQLLDFKTKKNKPYDLESIHFVHPGATEDTLRTALCISQSIAFTKTLANYPANICTPTYLAQQAIQLAHHHVKLDVKVLNREQMHKMGMGALLAVAQGSQEPPQLIELQYHGAAHDVAPVVLVGKGITFDSGGISLKPAEGMNEMKYDMAGAASVLGTIKACALLNLPINVIGLLACAENMPGGRAVKPGDIVTTYSGQTVEIVNTDAEGRLVLADALTYAERFHPRFVIDIATLTGAVIIALGGVSSGFMTNDDPLADLILAASRHSNDKAWRLPLDDAYFEALDSPIADMINASFNRSAGSITAGCFLSRFTTKYPWAHLDVAGSAWVSGPKRQATGRPVALLVQLLRDLAHAS